MRHFVQIPTVIGSDLVWIIQCQRALRRFDREHHVEKLARRIAFNIQFRAMTIAHRFEFVRIRVARDADPDARMQGNAMRAQLQKSFGKSGHIGIITPA